MTNFFARFGVPLSPVPLSSPFTTDNIDFSTGHVLPGTPSDPTQALQILAAQLQLYPYLPGGYNLPDPVPADLLLPFGDFAAKYNIQAAVPLIWTFAQGVGDLLKSPTLYVFQSFGLPQLESIQTASFLTTTDHFNSELYLKASALLGANVLYGSTVIDTDRHENGTHKITMQTLTSCKLIVVKKLLVTMPPILDNLNSFTLDRHEESTMPAVPFSLPCSLFTL